MPPVNSSPLSESELISQWMNHWTATRKRPKTVAEFAAATGLSEIAIADHIDNLNQLEKKVFAAFFSQTLSLLQASPELATYSYEEHLLAIYFSLFELLSANRDYVLLALQDGAPAPMGINPLNLPKLSRLQQEFTETIGQLAPLELPIPVPLLQQWGAKGVAEATWLQLLSILAFWLSDDSPNFEKTDAFIEKSVGAGADLMKFTDLSRLGDWGKFLFQERRPFK